MQLTIVTNKNMHKNWKNIYVTFSKALYIVPRFYIEMIMERVFTIIFMSFSTYVGFRYITERYILV